MKSCGLIGRSSYYGRADLETTRCILLYEQMREKPSAQPTMEGKQEPPKCKMCEQPLPPEPENKKGRPKEYCPSCESFRNAERYRRWRKPKKRLFAKSSSGGV